MEIWTIIAIVLALALGIFIGRYLLMQVFKSQKEKSEAEAKIIISEAKSKAENIKKDRELKAKEKFLDLKKEHDREVNKRNQNIQNQENRLKNKEQSLSQQIQQNKRKDAELDAMKENLTRQIEIIELKQKETEKAHNNIVKQLEKVANLSADEAKNQLIESLKNEAKTRAMSSIKDIMEEARMTANKEAKKIIVQAIQRTATEQAIENAISVFNIKNDDVKGQIIGREGRNIRALEAATGVEIIVDDTPEAILLSCFDPLRREMARLSLHRLVSDGRIHPARIEEVVAKTKKQLEEEVVEIGERTCIDLGIHGLHPEMVRLVGKMRYRSSYGQNLLHHSKEVARLCATMASEMGLNPKLAKRAGLLHDIGKVPDDDPELPHALLGMKIAEKHKENPIVCNAIGAHHDEIEMTHTISAIVQACDAISGARPGARREIIESYIKRLKDLENMAISFQGVQKAYAIQAGRELRVIVESEKVSDDRADILSTEISEKIQNEMQYPGQVKITVIREKRSVAYAK